MQKVLVDTHAHLCDRVFDQDRVEVISRAMEAGVEAIIIVGETLDDARRNVELAGLHRQLHPAAGLYPQYADPGEAERLVAFIRAHRDILRAIGEVGLDFRLAGEEPAREMQREVFLQFIRLAAELDLPLNVHSRSAGRHAVAMLLEHGASRVQMHAFDGKAAAALPAVDAGFFFSIPPSLARSRQKQKLVTRLPLSCLLVESDSPVLGPDPDRRNEPANAAAVIDVIAEIKRVSRAEVHRAVCENSLKLYGRI